MKIFCFSLLLTVFYLGVWAQKADTNLVNIDLKKYNTERILMTRNSMYVLGGWSVANLVTSGVGWAKGKGSNQYFHQGNVLWNIVNLSIVVPNLLSTKRNLNKIYSGKQTLKYQRDAEVTYLVNLGLDAGYMVTGLAMREYALNHPTNKSVNRLNGLGTSLLLQGGFLLLYDATMYSLHRQHSLKLTPANYIGNLGFTGNGFIYAYRF
jgi:hypothetical protein